MKRRNNVGGEEWFLRAKTQAGKDCSGFERKATIRQLLRPIVVNVVDQQHERAATLITFFQVFSDQIVLSGENGPSQDCLHQYAVRTWQWKVHTSLCWGLT